MHAVGRYPAGPTSSTPHCSSWLQYRDPHSAAQSWFSLAWPSNTCFLGAAPGPMWRCTEPGGPAQWCLFPSPLGWDGSGCLCGSWHCSRELGSVGPDLAGSGWVPALQLGPMWHTMAQHSMEPPGHHPAPHNSRCRVTELTQPGLFSPNTMQFPAERLRPMQCGMELDGSALWCTVPGYNAKTKTKPAWPDGQEP